MSQLLDLAETIGTVVATFLIVLGVIWHIRSGTGDELRNELARQRRRPNEAAAEDDLRSRIEDVEEKLELHRKHIIRIERRLIGAGVIIFALISALIGSYALVRDDWVPGLCFLVMALAFGSYGLVSVFGNRAGV
jgi:hypothetical protein